MPFFYENLNIRGPVGNLNGADNRPFYNRRALIDDDYSSIFLGTNTSEGYSYNATFKLTKPFENGFAGQLAYTYGESYNVFEGTSSQNSSQWRNLETVNGKNANPGIQRSNFALGSRFTANMSYEYEWNDNVKSTVSLFYAGEEGSPFTYVYNNRPTNLLNDDSRDNALIYIPRDASEITFKPIFLDDGETLAPRGSAINQWEDFNDYINSSSYLSERRGEYAARNGERGPWSHIVDLKFLQDFSVDLNDKKHTFQLSFDIFNFTNLINKDWGRRPFIPGNIGILNVEEGGPDPAFSFNADQFQTEADIENFDDSGILSSRWQMQVGLRYIFN